MEFLSDDTLVEGVANIVVYIAIFLMALLVGSAIGRG